MAKKILLTGGLGQIGTELTQELRKIYGEENVLCTDIHNPNEVDDPYYLQLDAQNAELIEKIVKEHKINIVYHMAGLLSATAEKFPRKGWDLNIGSLLTFLDLAKDKVIEQLFWPSSIAIFGAETPKHNTEEFARAIPTTVYGISKRAGEYWCNYYHKRYGVDVRSIRYPGLISWKTLPGGGTTDYAVDIFYSALEKGEYECFLKEDTALPMMYMEDGVRATIELMQADSDKISVRLAYNLHAMSFNPVELAKAIQKRIPDFKISYNPDFRQGIADTWPASIDDSYARRDWGWKPKYGMDELVDTMLENLRVKLGKTV